MAQAVVHGKTQRHKKGGTARRAPREYPICKVLLLRPLCLKTAEDLGDAVVVDLVALGQLVERHLVIFLRVLYVARVGVPFAEAV